MSAASMQAQKGREFFGLFFPPGQNPLNNPQLLGNQTTSVQVLKIEERSSSP